MVKEKRSIIIAGPTGVGKTDLALLLAKKVDAEIINADVGQFYKPLIIGTAKPDWKSFIIPHHLFDVLDEPLNFTVVSFRKKVEVLINEIKSRGKVPIIVGGSGFYLNSLFFPPQKESIIERLAHNSEIPTIDLWEKLNSIDSQRASQINENDRYRIERALDIWYGTGVLPSTYTPTFNALDDAYVLFLTRTIDDLYKRIDDRVKIMIQCEWLDEVENLSSDWHQFLLQKKLIGYDDIIRYLDNQINSIEELIALIQQKTRNYAKRQLTFNRMLTKKFEEHRNAV